MSNLFNLFDWKKMLEVYPEQNYGKDIAEKYHKILCSDFPLFLKPYLELPVLKRLKGIGLLCGTDWTKLYKNRFYYSRFDHSVGVALIIWNFTHDKTQTLSGLFHDIAIPVFSHVSDFRKGDALTQTVTEKSTSEILRNDKKLNELLDFDEIKISQIENYHLYPIADNEIPKLSADRLEYMFPSAMALEGSWTLDEIKKTYEDILILKNEEGKSELGFKTKETAENYCYKFCMTGHVLQLNENKLTLELLGKIMNLAVEENILSENYFMTKSESDVILKIESAKNICSKKMWQLYKTFRFMTKVIHSDFPLDENQYFCVNLKVKQRFINPLVKIDEKTSKRLSEISEKSKKIIEDFKSYKDTEFGCVKLEEI